ncbi:MAG: TonB family protein [Candidatus Acidiferrales bacterium]
MNRNTTIIAVVVCILFSLSSVAQQAAPAREIKMTAKKYEFEPSEVRVKQGERVRLLITATDRAHGLEIKELGIKVRLEEGKETPVEFTAEKPGEYEFKCSVRCGWRHGSMKGKLIVEPAGAANVSLPKCIHCPQPEYTEEARKAGRQGTVVLWVTVNEKGRVDDVQVSRGLGLGLEEQAVRAVSKWQFKPAERDGKPVPTYMTIEVDFHI